MVNYKLELKTGPRVVISTRFRQLREASGLSSYQVSEKLDMYRENITEIEAGRRKLKLEEMIAFCDLIRITPNEFLGY
jgi:transcriptional regulator with XRE-family HTH domain